MARKRLTSATLDDVQGQRVGGQAIDIASRILGPGASDSELVASARYLKRVAGDQGINALHRLASKVASESGEDFPGDLVDEGENDPRETQNYVAEHEVTPDHAVLDVVMNERTPTQNPTAAKGKDKPKDKPKDKKAKAGPAKKPAKPVKASDDLDEEEEPDLDSPDDVEMDEEDHVDDDDLDDAEDLGDVEDVLDDDMEDDDDSLEDSFEDEDDLDDDVPDDEAFGDDDDMDVNDDGDMDMELGSDDGDFTMDDMEELENMGVDGVLTSSHTGSAADSTRARRSSDGTVVRGRKAATLASRDTQRDSRRAYEESLANQRDSRGRRSAGRKTRRSDREETPSYRPARTRVASADSGANEFDGVWGDPDVSSEFAS